MSFEIDHCSRCGKTYSAGMIHTCPEEAKLKSKKPLHEIINDQLPSLKVSIIKLDDEVLYYDAYAEETEVEQLKDLLKELKVNVKIERRVF